MTGRDDILSEGAEEEPPVIKRNSHNAAIDALRGIAAAMVVIYHMDSFGLPVGPGEVAVMGALGVNLFFTLSGFLIGRAVLLPSLFDRRQYLRNRSLRILPNYFICCLLMLFLVEPRTIAHATPWHLAFDLGAHAVLMHGWFASISTSIIGPLWTLSHEWIFYLVIGLAAPVLRSRRGWTVPAAMFAIAVAAKFLVASRAWLPSTGLAHPFCRWDQFAMGIGGACLLLGIERRKAGPFWSWPAAGAGILLLGGCLYRQHAFATALHVTYLAEHAMPMARDFAMKFDAEFYRSRFNCIWFPSVFSAGVALLLVAFSSGFRKLDGWLKWTPFPWMGKVSYSTYLYHAAVLLCLARGLHPASGDALFHDRRVATVVVLLGVYAMSAFGYRYFEQPWLNRKAKSSS
ncbi:MAG: acyltransferase family protein [Verrucomicrobiaceae bacterium]|nr:acyltransferase family protein [Verrucomicrobiaceae bacterium]